MNAKAQLERPEEFPARAWRFANCEFDELRRELRVAGRLVELESKPLEVLRQLLLHAGEVVTKDELLGSVWPGVMVVDGSLATAVSKLRRALADDEKIVATVPRVGYRLAAPVQSTMEQPPAGPELRLSPGDSVPGRDQWHLVRRLDLSLSSEVWLAEHPKTHETRVFKFASDSVRLRALKREVTLARLLRDSLGDRPDFVRILEWNFDSAPYYLESEYAGPNLAEWGLMHGGIDNVPIELRLRLLIDIAQAIADAHALGVLHKDIKPANILVAAGPQGEPQIKVGDFGSGTLLDITRLGALGITGAGFTQNTESGASTLTGTVLYLAPEVLSGQSPSPASDVYALGVLLYQFIIGEFRKPLSPGWEAEVHDPLLRQDIADAAAGNPERRLASAQELVHRLRTLEERRLQRAATELNEQRRRSRATIRARLPWMLVAVAALLFAFAAGFNARRRPALDGTHAGAVTVLPFQNTSRDAALDPLRIALADEITTTLTHMRPLIVRPVAADQSSAAVDLKKVADELAVARIVTGRFVNIGGQLQVTVEAFDPDKNNVVWRDTVNVPAGDLLALQAQLSAIARNKLAPALGAPDFDGGTLPRAKNAEAYELYVRSMAPTGDPEPTRQAIVMLEKAIKLDPNYAPAWGALSARLYAASRFAGGGRALLDRSDEAAQRAFALDPSDLGSATELILHRAERGDLSNALRQASELLHSRPDNANLHHLMSYVERYGGLLQESVQQCNMTIQLDPRKWSPCSQTFMEAHDYPRAMSQLRPGLSSEWSRSRGIDILMRQGKVDDALRLSPPAIPGWDSYRIMLACARGVTGAEIASQAAAIRPDDDPEVNYLFASHLAYCGQSAAAVRLLQAAVNGHYCSYPAVDLDPLFDKIRHTPEFLSVRQSAIACQAEFQRELQSLH